MHIFEIEKKDGLEKAISADHLVTYASQAEPCHSDISSVIKNAKLSHKTLASYSDADLYYVKSILVSSTWNKNDDIFDSKEIWAARNTPEDKPTNLEHNEHDIIGHIVSNWPIDEEGNILPEDISFDDLPEKYHILTASVIYKTFSDPELKSRAEKLIDEINNGTKYVSMECYFKGFDYGLRNLSTGEYKILSRSDETAFLTKHLRAYGGLGEHEGYKIGRVLRGITFSGKGYVDKPANPDSIIFNKNSIASFVNQNTIEEKNQYFDDTGVSNDKLPTKMENITMSLENDIAEVKEVLASIDTGLKNTVKEAKEQVSVLEARNAELVSSVAEIKAELETAKSELETVKTELEVSNTELAAASEKAEQDKTEANAAHTEALSKIQEQLFAANEVIAGYKKQEEEMAMKEKKMKRMASLIEAGLDQETVAATIDQLDSVDDATFENFTSLLAAKKPPFMMEKEEDKNGKNKKEEKKVASESEIADESVLETAEPEETIDISVGGSEDEDSSTQAALIDFVFNRLGKTLKSKGE